MEMQITVRRLGRDASETLVPALARAVDCHFPYLPRNSFGLGRSIWTQSRCSIQVRG